MIWVIVGGRTSIVLEMNEAQQKSSKIPKYCYGGGDVNDY